ncbi:MAG: hypothetical protein RBR68_07010 [Tenuifilaceae bacterium]|jgi:hypothetical protein|nr:hypothetical protein [Tenuifilaceae bacterium]
MKGFLRIFIGAIIILVLLLIGMKAIWLFKEKKVISVYILDKTVTKYDRHAHKSFTWLLNYNRIVLPNKKQYSYKTDYFGFFPININDEVFDFKSIRISEVDDYASNSDVLFYADCYGVHSFEWYKGKSKPIRSQKVFGGLNQNDYLLLKRMLDNGKLAIAEYNMFSTPTNALVRIKTEELLGINWSGWTGKYFETFNVSSENGAPVWMKNLYESQHLGVWPDKGSGIILINNDGLIELLELGNHINSPIPIIQSNSESIERFNVSQSVPFEEWFEFISPGNNLIHSNFSLDVTPKGKEVLQKIGLTEEFPAVIEGLNLNYFYFCGDFSENPANMWTAKLAGGKWLNHFISRFSNTNKANFYQNYYTPLIEKLLSEHYEKLNNSQE